MKGVDEQPVFIIGNPRSGTTLLRLMLTSHPEVCIPPEAGFALWLRPDFEEWVPEDGIDRFLTSLMDTRKFHHWGLSRPQVAEWILTAGPEDYGSLVAEVYRCYAARVSPRASIWGDKNNFYVGQIAAIRSLFPRSRFVHIVRDGRNVATSYRELGSRDLKSEYAPKLPQEIETIATEWSSTVDGVGSALADADTVMTLRLEDLQDAPTDELTKVCDLLGIGFDEGMLHYHELSEGSGGEPEEFAGWKAKNRLPVLASDRERYRSELTPGEIARFEEVAGATLQAHGYPLGTIGD